MELSKLLTSIWNLEEAINETEKQNSLKERIVLENGKFTAISKNSSKTHTLAPLLQDIQSTLDQTFESLAKSNGSETDLFKIATLEREIFHIKNWEEKAVNSFYKSHSKLGRNILHCIPFSRWREAWLNADLINKEHEQIQQRINQIESQCITTRRKIAQQKFQTFKSSIEEKKSNFVTVLSKNSNEIKELILAPIDKEEKLYQISNKLRSMETEVNNLKTFANTIHNNIREITADSREINYLITDRKEITEVQNDLTLLLDEIAQLTNSAIYFLQDSLPDETEVFFTPMADPEQKSSDKEPTIADRIQKNQSEATVLIKYCARLLKEDINKNKSALILAYVRLQEILDNSFAIMHSSYVNTGGSEKINEEKQEIRALEAKLGKLNKEFKFKNLFSIFFEARVKEIKNESSQIKSQIFGKMQIIKKREEEEKIYSVAYDSLKNFVVEFSKLSNILRNEHIIDAKKQPAGEVTIKLTNSILKGRHTIATNELIKLSAAYSHYITRLTALQQNCAKASTALSMLGSTIEDSQIPASPAARKRLGFSQDAI